MSAIEWGAPPRKATGKPGPAKEFVEALKGRPGEWAKYPTAFASHGACGSMRSYYRHIEWASRKQDDGTIALWGRWVGEDGAA